ncbi:MAG: hypothetical protein ACLRNW_19750 [Neglectibacter sp.]
MWKDKAVAWWVRCCAWCDPVAQGSRKGDVLAFAKEDPVTGCIQKIVVATIDGKKLRPNEWYGADLEKKDGEMN